MPKGVEIQAAALLVLEAQLSPLQVLSREDGSPGHGCRTACGQERSELFPKAVDVRDKSSGFSFSVDEHDAVDQVFELVAAVEFSPA